MNFAADCMIMLHLVRLYDYEGGQEEIRPAPTCEEVRGMCGNCAAEAVGGGPGLGKQGQTRMVAADAETVAGARAIIGRPTWPATPTASESESDIRPRQNTPRSL